MKLTMAFVVLATICLSVACQPNEKETIELGASADGHSFMKLTLFPIKANNAFLKHSARPGTYLTLADAVSKKKVTITERVGESVPMNAVQAPVTLEQEPVQQQVLESGAEVNKLFVENHSEDTVLILGGEVVEGGNQDRTIAQDVVLPPHSGKVDLSVFCVEHGRWAGDSDTFAVAKSSLAPSKVRKAAMKSADQQEVWDNVAMELVQNKVVSGTQTVLELKRQDEYLKSQREFEQALANAFADDKSVIGVIAVAGNEIIACELFASHELFETYYPNLLQSWVSQAMAYEGEEMPDGKMVETFFNQTVSKRIMEEDFIGNDKRSRANVPHLSIF